MKRIIVKPKTEGQLKVLKAFLKAMKIDFRIDIESYDPEFVEKILQGREDIKNGKGIKIETNNLWNVI